MHIIIWNANGAVNELISLTAGEFEDGAWHHVVWTYDGTAGTNGLKLYIDGSLDTQMTASSTGIRNFTGTWSDITVGDNSQQAGGWAFGGNVDEVGLWDGVVLSPTDVTNIYNAGSPITLSDYSPDSWYQMGDGATWDGSNWSMPNKANPGS